ncbi:MAG TPA: homoserine kinase [Salinisphaeraceae bacterium]|nr:homoserine kinase [Salinisphaeraceae bacterium]
MAVYTKITRADLETLLAQYDIGSLQGFEGIASGITNTNYFVTTSHGRWVLTLFEHMTAAALPFFMTVMDHFSAHGIPSAHPVLRNDGGFLSTVCERPAALVYLLQGASIEQPDLAQCRALGEVVAAMHRAAKTLSVRQQNTRGLPWIREAAAALEPRLDADTAALLQDEIAAQNEFAASADWQQLAQAVIHADIFRDNVLFAGHRVSGIIDFYYACHDYLLFDLAIICNDWCFDAAIRFLPARWQAFIHAYGAQRALTAVEQRAWPAMLRAAALRFWASRLYDYHFPINGDASQMHDPAPYERLLRLHRTMPPALLPEPA